MSLEQLEECNAEGIKESMDNAVSKMKFNFKWSEKEIGMCSDGAMVNFSVYNLLQDEFGEQYLCILCPSHTFELSINDAFGSSVLSNNTEKNYIEIYYFLKKSPLRWRLFKRQSLYMGLDKTCYKRLSGTRWVEHRIAALESHLHNLPILNGFCDQEIKQSHNHIVPVLEGIHKNIASTKSLLFNSLKLDILNLLQPMSKILQDTSLLSPTFIITCKVTMQNVKCMKKLVEEKQREAFHDNELFHYTRLVLNQLTEEVQKIVPQHQIHFETAKNPDHNYSLLHDYLLSCGVDESLDAVINEALEIIDKDNFFDKHFSCFMEDDFLTVTAVFLDTKSYVNEDCE